MVAPAAQMLVWLSLRRDAIPEEDASIRLSDHNLGTCILAMLSHSIAAAQLVRVSMHAPEAPMHTGACSLEDPHPKFSPAMTTLYSVFMLPSSMNLAVATLISQSYCLLQSVLGV